MNNRYYIDKLTYEVGETIIYFGERHKVVYIHEVLKNNHEFNKKWGLNQN